MLVVKFATSHTDYTILMYTYTSPLSVFLVWNHLDDDVVQPIVSECMACLKKDPNRLFSRLASFPVFIRTSSPNSFPHPISSDSTKTIVFVFVGSNCMGDDAWVTYLEEIPTLGAFEIVPIALDSSAYNLKGAFELQNFIRASDLQGDDFHQRLMIEIYHEIYRYGLNDRRAELEHGKDSALKLFLSHAKDKAQGIALAQALKQEIDNGRMSKFFDSTGIAIGYSFGEEILANIKDSTMLAIHSDTYSSRYWCQREILAAKAMDRPILAVDAIRFFEDRRFPIAANLPAVRVYVRDDNAIDNETVLEVLKHALLESIRFYYTKQLLNAYQSAGWFPTSATISARPPEAFTLAQMIGNGTTSSMPVDFVYPDPPVFEEESSHLAKFGIRVFTPLTFGEQSLAGKAVGISVSEPSPEELLEIGQTGGHLFQLSQELGRYILGLGAELVYGGDLRPGGFTEFLFQEGHALQSRLRSQTIHLTNYIAWPIHSADKSELRDWKANHRSVATMQECALPSELTDIVAPGGLGVCPTGESGAFVWARCLSEMRMQMIGSCNGRISAGGRLVGYNGWMPGVMEEIAITLELRKPVFLLGGFGGVTRLAGELILEETLHEHLSFDWQMSHNPGLREMISFARSRGIDYESQYAEIVVRLKGAALSNGLTPTENKRLLKTPFVDEIVHLVLKGLGNM
jgi:hypothetical protein